MRLLLLLLAMMSFNISAGTVTAASGQPSSAWGPLNSTQVQGTGGLLLNDASATCGSSIAGSLRWHSSALEVCNGSSWGSVGGSTSADGDTGEIQFNSGDEFAADNDLFWDNTNKRLGLGTQTPQRDLHVLSAAGEPTIMFTQNGQAANGKHWQYTVSSGNWYVQAMNDALEGSTGMVLSRTGGTATTLTLSSTYNNCAGGLTTNGSNVVQCVASDEKLKKDIVPFERGLEAVAGLTPKSFKFKDPADLNIEHTGFVAQNVAKSIPEAVTIGTDGYMQLNHWAIIAAQANAINELRARLEALEAKNSIVVPKKPVIQMKPLHQNVAPVDPYIRSKQKKGK